MSEMSWLCIGSSKVGRVVFVRGILLLLVCLIFASPITMTAQRKERAVRKRVSPASDDQRTYQNKCMSCHREVRKYREGKEATILRHMRVRGDLTEKETQAILRYLTQ